MDGSVVAPPTSLQDGGGDVLGYRPERSYFKRRRWWQV